MEEKINEIDHITGKFEALCKGLSTDELNWKNKSRSWSIAQVMVHLNILNSSYFPIFDEVLEGAYRPPFHARFGFIRNMFGNFLLRSVKPEYSRKLKTVNIWEPEKNDFDGNILSEFTAQQELLKEYFMKFQGHAVEEIAISSPANKNIVYTLGKAMEILIAHEKRHLQQAERVKSSMKRSS